MINFAQNIALHFLTEVWMSRRFEFQLSDEGVWLFPLLLVGVCACVCARPRVRACVYIQYVWHAGKTQSHFPLISGVHVKATTCWMSVYGTQSICLLRMCSKRFTCMIKHLHTNQLSVHRCMRKRRRCNKTKARKEIRRRLFVLVGLNVSDWVLDQCFVIGFSKWVRGKQFLHH